MCGILISLSNSEEKIMSIAHRGIEHLTIHHHGVYLTHHRLPIQTLDGDNWQQPIEISDGVFLLFNGEIFNYDGKIYSSDTEYLVDLFRGWRGDNLQLFAANYLPHILTWDGFWSIAIYDSNSKDVIAFTDPLGKKQLYKNDLGEVASEVKALKTSQSSIDNHFISTIRKFGYNRDLNTIYTNVKRLEPNAFHHWNLSSPTFLTSAPGYFNFTHPISELIGQDYDAHMDWLWVKMFESVKSRTLVTKYPTSILVSGGLDSSIIAAIMYHQKLDTQWFTIENGETEYVNLLSKQFDKSPVYLNYSMQDDHSYIYQKWNESPIDLGSVIPQYYLFDAIRQNSDFRVVISGDGSDELFGGYRRIKEYDSQSSDIFDELSYYHLPRLDRMSMAHTIELRNPFLHHDIIRFALTLPLEWRTDKKILKDTFGPILPSEIVNRQKEALKNPEIKKNSLEYRYKVVDDFLSGLDI
jgi:asparagine synthase (glutamine-hydrolysing)